MFCLFANDAKKMSEVNSPPTIKDFDNVFSALKAEHIPIPVEFNLFGHTDLHFDIRQIEEFEPSYIPGNSLGIKRDEIGTIYGHNFRIILSPNFLPHEKVGIAGTKYLTGMSVPENPGHCDAYPLIFIEPNFKCYGTLYCAVTAAPCL